MKKIEYNFKTPDTHAVVFFSYTFFSWSIFYVFLLLKIITIKTFLPHFLSSFYSMHVPRSNCKYIAFNPEMFFLRNDERYLKMLPRICLCCLPSSNICHSMTWCRLKKNLIRNAKQPSAHEKNRSHCMQNLFSTIKSDRKSLIDVFMILIALYI